VVGDTLKRYYRALGYETYFLTGTDEHGDKIAQAAAAGGTDPQSYVDRISGLFRSTWDSCGIDYDHFIRTTDVEHKAFVQKLQKFTMPAGLLWRMWRLLLLWLRRFIREELVDGSARIIKRA
jgi:methionyl-tRNA synthetase